MGKYQVTKLSVVLPGEKKKDRGKKQRNNRLKYVSFEKYQPIYLEIQWNQSKDAKFLKEMLPNWIY